MGRIVEVGLNASRRAPVELADAVEQHYRKSGRHGRLHWSPDAGIWTIKVTLRPTDRRLQGVQEGTALMERHENIDLVEWNPKAHRTATGRWCGAWVGYNLDELGVGGLIDYLEKADLWSGRGEFDSLSEAVAFAHRSRQEANERNLRRQRDEAIQLAMDKRRSLLKIPFLGVGINLKRPAKSPAGGN